MPTPERLTVALAAGLVTILASTTGAAQGVVPGRHVWVEARPWTCARELPSFAANVQLACDAMGGECDVAASRDEGTEVATLFCEAGRSWAVSSDRDQTSDAHVIVVLDGEREERLRRAAMWIARDELAPPVPVPAPESTREAPRPEAPPLPLPSVTAPFLAPPILAPPFLPPPFLPAPAPPSVPRDAAKRSRAVGHGGVTVSAFTGVTDASVGSQTVAGVAGVRAELAIPLGRGFYLGPSVSYLSFYEGSWAGPWTGLGADVEQGMLGGVTAGWGAPFDDHWIGVSVGGGGGGVWGNGTVSSLVVEPQAYGCAAFTLQVPVASSPVRPTLTLSGMQLARTDALGASGQVALLELGVAWQAF